MTKTSTKILYGSLGALLFFCGAGTLASCDASHGDDTASATSSASPIPSSPQPIGLTEGLYLVGQDIKEGSYRTAGAKQADIGQMCYAHSARDEGNVGIITQLVTDKTDAPQRITLKRGQFFKTSGCQPWIEQ